MNRNISLLSLFTGFSLIFTCLFISLSETLPVEKLGGRPMCMDQYYKILSACRIPGIKRDEVENYARSWRPPQHIVVVKNNHVSSVS